MGNVGFGKEVLSLKIDLLFANWLYSVYSSSLSPTLLNRIAVPKGTL